MALFHADSTYWYRAGRRGKFERNFPSDFGEYELLADIEVTGSAVSQVDITGLSLDSDDEILLVAEHTETDITGPALLLYVNGNTTSSNYYSQQLGANGTSVSGSRVNDPRFMGISAGVSRSLSRVDINLTESGYFTWQSHTSRDFGGSGIRIQDWYGTSTFTLSTITSLRIYPEGGFDIDVGSRFWLYKKGSAS